MAKIGIVLATYNGEKYLPQMLDSLIAQTRPANFIVAVDDGSKDNTVNILKSYQERLPIQLTVMPQNKGHRAAFSKALELALPQLEDDDLIALADHDDVWLPKKLELLEKAISSYSANLVFGDAQVIDGDGNKIGNSWRQMDSIPEYLSLRALLTGFTNVTGCMSIFKAKLLKLVLPIPENVPVHDQWIAFCASLYANNNKGCQAIKESVIQYRIHGQNAIGLGKNHSWTNRLKTNLQWSKALLDTPQYKELFHSDQKFLKRYISYVQDRLTKPFIPQYLMWIIKNVNSLYPHVQGILKYIPRILYGIIGAPIIIHFFGKK